MARADDAEVAAVEGCDFGSVEPVGAQDLKREVWIAVAMCFSAEDRINAVVVLTDGDDTDSSRSPCAARSQRANRSRVA